MSEAAAQSLDEAVSAVAKGVTRLHVCNSYDEDGGLTPTLGLILSVDKFLTEFHPKIKYRVVIRTTHLSTSSSRYTDYLVALNDVKTILQKADKLNNFEGFIFGFLDPAGSLDLGRIADFIEVTGMTNYDLNNTLNCGYALRWGIWAIAKRMVSPMFDGVVGIADWKEEMCVKDLEQALNKECDATKRPDSKGLDVVEYHESTPFDSAVKQSHYSKQRRFSKEMDKKTVPAATTGHIYSIHEGSSTENYAYSTVVNVQISVVVRGKVNPYSKLRHNNQSVSIHAAKWVGPVCPDRDLSLSRITPRIRTRRRPVQTNDTNRKAVEESVEPKLTVFLGTGLSAICGSCKYEKYQTHETVWSTASSYLRIAEVGGEQCHVAFLYRHGVPHSIPPHQIPYRANIAAIRGWGATDMLSFCTVGSLKREYAPGDFVLVDQYIDRTTGRASSFFERNEVVAHVRFDEPTCYRLAEVIIEAAKGIPELRLHTTGTLVCINGPHFSTRAEAEMHLALGADLVGMTTATEAKLAREAELCYANVAIVTDYDCVAEDNSENVTSDKVLMRAFRSAELAEKLLRRVVAALPKTTRPACEFGCNNSLDDAICNRFEAENEILRSKYSMVSNRAFGVREVTSDVESRHDE